jgi:PAS domain S-box-containing protein
MGRKRRDMSKWRWLVPGFFWALVWTIPAAATYEGELLPPEIARVQLNGGHRFRYAGFYAAISKGFYREAGLEVVLREGGPGVDPVAEVVARRAEYGVSGVDLLPRFSRGEPVVAMAAVFQHSPAVLVVRGDSGINRPEDLIGRRIMADPESDVAIEAMLRNAGVDLSEIRWVPRIGDYRELVSGRVDAMAGDLALEPYRMEREGVLAFKLDPAVYGIDFYGDCLFASRDEPTSRPGRARAMRRATLRGWEYAMNHPEEIMELIRLRYDPGLSLSYLRFESLVMRQLILPDLVEMGHMSLARWRHIGDVYRMLGMIPADAEIDFSAFLYNPYALPDNRWTVWFVAGAAGIALAAGLWALVLTAFNARLNTRVRKRTAELESANERLAGEIAERRQAEEALLRSQELYALVIRGSNDGIWDWDLPADSVYFSPRWKEIIGYADDEIPNDAEEWRKRIHPEDIEAVMAAHEDYWKGRTDVFRVVYRLRGRDGAYRWILGRAACIWDEDGNPRRMAGSHTDITERKRTEAELGALRRLLRNIIDALPSAIVAVDAQGRVTHWSREAARKTGLSSDAAVGMSAAAVFPILAGRWEAVFEAIRMRRSFRDIRLSVPESDDIRHYDVTVSPLSREEDAGAVIRVDDTTERVRMEEMMIQSEKMLSVGGLAAGMAHEINNPLAAVMANAQLIWSRLAGDLPPNRRAAERCGIPWEALLCYLEERDIRGRLDGILEAGGRAAEIVENMLRFSRKSETRVSEESLRELAERTIALLRNDYRIKKEMEAGALEIRREFDPDLPGVPCAATEIQQVLLNLLTNAAHALREDSPRRSGRPGRIDVRTRWEGDWACLDVIDSGPGIEASVQRRIFEPFFTTKGPGAGTGLGLSVSYFIVTENHGGTLAVSSAPGHGTTFVVRLPLRGRNRRASDRRATAGRLT